MKGSRNYYKGRYFIAFYNKQDEFVQSFDNVREILKFIGKDVNRKTINYINIQIYRALKSEEHFTNILGETHRVYLIDIN